MANKKPFRDEDDAPWTCEWRVPRGTNTRDVLGVLDMMGAEKIEGGESEGALRYRATDHTALDENTYYFIQDLIDGKAQAYVTQKPFRNRFKVLGELGSLTHSLGMGQDYLVLTPHHDLPLCVVVRAETNRQKGAIDAWVKSLDVPPQKDQPNTGVTDPKPKPTRGQGGGRGRGGASSEPDAET